MRPHPWGLCKPRCHYLPISLYFSTLEERPGSTIPDQRYLFVQKLPHPSFAFFFFFWSKLYNPSRDEPLPKIAFQTGLFVHQWMSDYPNLHLITHRLFLCLPVTPAIMSLNETKPAYHLLPKHPSSQSLGIVGWALSTPAARTMVFHYEKGPRKEGIKNTSLPSSKPQSLTSRTKSSRGLPWWSSG